MGLLKTYAIYKYGRKKGIQVYEDATILANTKRKEAEKQRELEDEMRKKCSMCGHKYMQHSEEGSCPTYI
jgi:hypothetical protein